MRNQFLLRLLLLLSLLAPCWAHEPYFVSIQSGIRKDLLQANQLAVCHWVRRTEGDRTWFAFWDPVHKTHLSFVYPKSKSQDRQHACSGQLKLSLGGHSHTVSGPKLMLADDDQFLSLVFKGSLEGKPLEIEVWLDVTGALE